MESYFLISYKSAPVEKILETENREGNKPDRIIVMRTLEMTGEISCKLQQNEIFLKCFQVISCKYNQTS